MHKHYQVLLKSFKVQLQQFLINLIRYKKFLKQIYI